jgi:hypothetical protein
MAFLAAFGKYRASLARSWWGRQSCLQAAFQAAVSTEPTTRAVGTYFLRLRVSPASCGEAREISLETERPAESRGASFARHDKLKHVLPLLLTCALHAATIRGNVVENISGRPLARATVVVRPVGKNSDVRDAIRGGSADAIAAATAVRQQRNRSELTNPSGIFEFASLPAGTYLISAEKLEFMPVAYGQKRWYSPGMPIALEAGDEASLTIRMPRFGAITGDLLDENDVGLPGHEVAVYTNTRPPKLLARSVTDDRGMYRVFDLLPGSYLVRSLSKQYDDESYLPTFYRDSPTVDQGRAIEVKLDEEVAHMDFHAAPGRLFTVSGRATGAPGQPIVTLASDTGTEIATIDGIGNFSFNPMAPGTYELQAEIPSDRTHPRIASFQMLTVDRDLTDVRPVLSPLPSVQFVYEDTGGHPIKLPEGLLMARRNNPAGESTEKGIPSVGPLLPGRWQFALKNQPSYCVVGFRTPQESATEGRFDGWNEMPLAPGSGQSVVKFVLSQSCATIGGTVKNANGDGVADVPVFVEAYDLDQRKRVYRALTLHTDSKGQYSQSGLVPGVYRLMASFDLGIAQMDEAQAVKVTVEEGAHVTLDLEEFVIH